ncbi:hypothetical protein HID58_065587 [Brassica napus]|uniref:Uncharacterized protein n=1 Tax=Brassica napus TaxID=3708 RepID=A0ABQ7ZDA5_BRANA|nr:hypothetical protein HID58_065587 [Brassica napus]
MIGTASSWLGQSLVVFDVVFLNVGLPSIVTARLDFQDLIFGVLTSMLSFIARGRLHTFIASLVALHFTMFATRGLDNVFVRVCYMGLEETASFWLGQSLVVFDVVFLNVGLPSIVTARLDFQDLIFGVLTSILSFIARGRLHTFIASLVALHFTMFATLGLDNVFVRACYMGLEGTNKCEKD